jgi:poly(hydroxyalkanoate) depolymerase family esterase
MSTGFNLLLFMKGSIQMINKTNERNSEKLSPYSFFPSFMPFFPFPFEKKNPSLPKETKNSGKFLTKTAPDGRKYRLYVPSGYLGEALPLLIVLHGCTQTPEEIAAGTQMNALAEKHNFFVAYPKQPASANHNNCWKWFDKAHQHRGSGEPASIAGIVRQVRSFYNIKSRQTYAAGFSSGGAMAVIMGVTYPDLFSGIGIVSGLQYKAATSLLRALSTMGTGGNNPDQCGVLAYKEMDSRAKLMPIIVFHGTRDLTVSPRNGDQIISQWAKTNDLIYDGIDNNDIRDTPSIIHNTRVPGGRLYTKSTYLSPDGHVLMLKYTIDGLGHAWPGGHPSVSYTDSRGPNASEMMWEFFQYRSWITTYNSLTS